MVLFIKHQERQVFAPQQTISDVISSSDLFGGTDNLKEQRYYFCITATAADYTLTAKHTSKTCQITLTNLNMYNRTGCDG